MQDEYSIQLKRVVDLIEQRQASLREKPTVASKENMNRAVEALPPSLPDSGMGLQATVDSLINVIAPALAPGHAGPRFFGFVTGGYTPAAQLGDFVTTSFDNNAQVNLHNATISTYIEHLCSVYVLDLLKIERDNFQGRTLTTGATSSNLLGLAVGRQETIRKMKSDQDWNVAQDGTGGIDVDVYAAGAHASIMKSAAILGIGRSRVVALENDDSGSVCDFDTVKLESRLQESKDSNRASIVVASIGEVNTGGITRNLSKVRELCDKYGAWLHMDGAFGAFACLHPSFSYLSQEMCLADSLTIDAHKWLQTTYDCALFYCRSQTSLESVCGPGTEAPAYLSSTSSSTSNQLLSSLASPLNTHIENSTRARGIALYCTLLCMGNEGYSNIVKQNIEWARCLARWLDQSEEWDVLTPPERASAEPLDRHYQIMNVVLFAPKKAGSTSEVVRRINESREMYVSPTVWKGRSAIRVAVSNWMTNEEDLEQVKNVLTRVVKEK